MYIKATETTPEVFFEEANHTLTIQGKSLNDKENTQFYKNLEDWADNYVEQNQPEKFIVNLKLEAIDINAGISLKGFLKNLDYLNDWEGIEIQVNWYYMNEEILEIGEEWLSNWYFDFELIVSVNEPKTKSSISSEMRENVKNLNQRLYNAGYYFRVWAADSQTRYVMGSFNPFFNYKNVDVYFEEILWTNLSENATWSDAWYNDQLFLLNRTDLEEVAQKFKIDIPSSYFGFQWNMADKHHYLGVIICKSLKINWL